MFVLVMFLAILNFGNAEGKLKVATKEKFAYNSQYQLAFNADNKPKWCNEAFVTFSCGITAIATFCNVTAEQFMFSLMLADMAFCQQGADYFLITFPN
ncbi:hypothetical protein [Raineya orbicola]|uniref:Uncharacterized protein n=1 Tax=Raineya orbicola TaxID=2016530 RepID=A0A2N3IAQ0_9BACT|nr:hypothetical protein [Raineya orbicola]PKQ67444.1 hypothetical protein Rain11_1997 [Raineya orbicola]